MKERGGHCCRVCRAPATERLLGKYLLNVRLSSSVVLCCFVCKRKNRKQQKKCKTLGSQLNKRRQNHTMECCPCHLKPGRGNAHNTPPSLERGLTSRLTSRAWSRNATTVVYSGEAQQMLRPWTPAVINHVDVRYPDGMPREGSPPQNHYRSLIVRKRSDKPNGPTFYKTPERCPSKLSRSQNRRKGNSLA